MKFLSFALGFGILLTGFIMLQPQDIPSGKVLATKLELSHWFILHRKSNIEELMFGIPGNRQKSKLLKEFTVKTGISGQRPTPLPQLLGREYWIIIDKFDDRQNPETAPFFLTLDVPVSDTEPFGPMPYLECNGEQCNWVREGLFGLHGVAGDESRLSPQDPGSSGCIRHRDEDITYLFSLLNPKDEEIRYYIEDN